MESLGAGMERYFPEARRLRPVASINEFRRALLGELDFVREAGNTSRLAENFRLSPEISFPEVCWELTTARVLTLGFMQGWPVGDREELLRHGVDPKLVVERGLKAFMKMVFVDGMFHGDLHPGNVLVLPEGRVGFLDCGVAVQISRTTRENLAGLLMALTQEDYEAVVSYFVELSDPDADFDLDAFRHEVANTLSPFMRLRLGDIPTGTLFRELARISAAHGAPMPRELLLFVKTLLTYEAIGHKLDPEFELFPVAESFAKDIVSEFYSIRAIKRRGVTLMREAQMLARHAPYQLRRLLKGASDGTLSLNIASDDVRDIAHAVDRSFARLVKGQMAGFTLLAASVLTVAGEVTDARRLTLFGGIGFILAALLGGAAILGGGGPTRRK
jgi:ubiquinone biosynthesis protein